MAVSFYTCGVFFSIGDSYMQFTVVVLPGSPPRCLVKELLMVLPVEMYGLCSPVREVVERDRVEATPLFLREIGREFMEGKVYSLDYLWALGLFIGFGGLRWEYRVGGVTVVRDLYRHRLTPGDLRSLLVRYSTELSKPARLGGLVKDLQYRGSLFYVGRDGVYRVKPGILGKLSRRMVRYVLKCRGGLILMY